MHRFPPPDMKMEWPETVGLDVDAARDIVLKECPDVHIQVLGEFSPCTMDLRMDRVRIVTNSENKVLVTRRG